MNIPQCYARCAKYEYVEEMCLPLGREKQMPCVIVAADMFDVAREESARKKSVLLHNFANNERPGLFLMEGPEVVFFTQTQEEQLLRASLRRNALCVDTTLYPICQGKEDKALVSWGAQFTKDPRTGMEQESGKHFKCDIVTCALSVQPATDQKGDDYAHKVDEAQTLRRMILVLNLAAKHDVFITGLWGCGAFGHPAKAICALWKTAMRLATCLPKTVVFALKLDASTSRHKIHDLTRILSA